MGEIIEEIITLLVGSAVFITGMDLMSAGLKKAAGPGLKNMLRRIQNNRLAGLGIGAAITAIIQSSAATSVMALGFVNANVMSIFQAVSIILGAYIGTSVTGLLVSLSSFSISAYLMLLAFVGVVMSFFKNEKVKNIGQILAGLGILFFGLETMSGAFDNSSINDFCQKLFSEINFPLLLMVIGAIFTALVQSSSATTGIVIVMVGKGALSMTNGFYLILGATIGTVITTFIATIGGTSNAKRVALIAFMVSALCAIIATLIIWVTGSAIANGLVYVFKEQTLAVAMFQIFYKIIFMSSMLPFIRVFEKISIKLIKDKNEDELKASIKFIDDNLLNTPTVAMMQVKKEIINMLSLSNENLKKAYNKIKTHNDEDDDFIVRTEDQIDYINQRIADYLIKVSTKVSLKDEKKVGSYFHVINDIERIGDHAFNFYEMAKDMEDNKQEFSPNAIEEFDKMFGVVEEMCNLSEAIFENKNKDDLLKLHELENQTDVLKTELSQAHYNRIIKNECHVELSPFYTSLVSALERVADHLVNIGYSIVSPTGEDINDK